MFQHEKNPLTVQFWLWGIDAARGDLERRGFKRTARPTEIKTKSSIYQLGALHLHSNVLWLEDQTLLYHRGQERFFQSSKILFSLETPELEILPFALGLEKTRALILEHEHYILGHRGQQYRNTLREGNAPFGVRRAWNAWQRWLELNEIQTPIVQDQFLTLARYT